MTNRLDFAVIGAQKAGTTSLFEYMRTHPSLLMPPDKESPFFSSDAVYERGLRAYLDRTFPSRASGRLLGTATPQYMLGSLSDSRSPAGLESTPQPERIVPLRMRELLPDIKLIAILRDPVARAVSHYRMQVLRRAELRSFDAMTEELLRPEQIERSRRIVTESNGYVTIGEYGRVLAGYFEVFEPSQILICFTSDLEATPRKVTRSIYEFLGVDPDYAPSNLGARYRVAANRRRLDWLDPTRFGTAARRVAPARAAWRRLSPASRSRLHRGYHALAYRIELSNRAADTGTPSVSSLTEVALREHYGPDRRLLETLIGREPTW